MRSTLAQILLGIFCLYFFDGFGVVGEVALAADLITAWKTLPGQNLMVSDLHVCVFVVNYGAAVTKPAASLPGRIWKPKS